MILEVMAQKIQLRIDTFSPTVEKLTILTTIGNKSICINPIDHTERNGIRVPPVASPYPGLLDPTFNQPPAGSPEARVTLIDKLACTPDGIIEVMKIVIP